MDDFKLEIQKIEAEILSITGTYTEKYFNWTEYSKKRNRVEFLLKRRRNLLNDMFQFTEQNIERMRVINCHLTYLTEQVYKRVRDFDSFINDYRFQVSEEELESCIKFIYRSEDSVLKLEDDEYYGSNFTLMIKVLADLYIAKSQ